MYLILAIINGYIGYLYSVFIRLELSIIGTSLLFGDFQFYNVLITSHGLIMIFGFIMPVIMGGIANYFGPIMLGYPDMVFPRLNNISFWLFFFGFLLLACAFLTEEGIGVGWTLYPSLICIDFHSSLACDFIIFSVHLLGFSSIINSLNILGTFFVAKKKFFSMLYIIMFLWSAIITSILLILCLPVLAGGVTMLLLDRNFNTSFFDVLGGGDLVLFQHIFWFFGHPEVYIIIIPIFGLISTMLEVIGIKNVFSALAMIYSMILISILGFFVWAHHMFTIGLDLDSRSYFGSITLLIGLPTCIKLFNWFYTFCFYDFLWTIEIYFIITFIFMFLFGGITGLILANVGIDILLHDTYFVVAHFHYVLSLGAVIGFLGAFYHFFYKIIPIEMNNYNIIIIIVIIFLGSNMLFLPLHSLGLLGFPRRISDYPISFLIWNYFVFIGLLLLFLFTFIFCTFNLIILITNKCIYIYIYNLISINNFNAFINTITFISTILYTIIKDYTHYIIDLIYTILTHNYIFYIFFWKYFIIL